MNSSSITPSKIATEQIPTAPYGEIEAIVAKLEECPHFISRPMMEKRLAEGLVKAIRARVEDCTYKERNQALTLASHALTLIREEDSASALAIPELDWLEDYIAAKIKKDDIRPVASTVFGQFSQKDCGELNTFFADLYIARGIAFSRRGSIEGAIQCFYSAIKAAPGLPQERLLNLATLLANPTSNTFKNPRLLLTIATAFYALAPEASLKKEQAAVLLGLSHIQQGHFTEAQTLSRLAAKGKRKPVTDSLLYKKLRAALEKAPSEDASPKQSRHSLN